MAMIEIRAIVDANGEVYYNGKDLIGALKAEASSPLLYDNNLVVFIKRFIHQLVDGGY
jgi:hypothetical protein